MFPNSLLTKDKTTILKILPLSNTTKEYYSNHIPTQGNAGYDLIFPTDMTIPPHSCVLIPLGIKCRCVLGFSKEIDTSYLLLPRSSIYKTPLLMANSIGLIDASYRGEICAAVRNLSSEPYLAREKERLFQLAPLSTDGQPFDGVEIVESLNDTSRGEGGFGSSGK